MASSPVRSAVEAYAAGRLKAEQVVAAVVPVYFRAPPGKQRDTLRPLVEVIERAAPGVVELAETAGAGTPGFQVRLAERPFPKGFEAELKRAAEAALARDWSWDKEAGLGTRDSGLVSRIVDALRRLFSA